MIELISLPELQRLTGWGRKRILKPLEAMNENGPLRGLVVIYVGKRKRPHFNKAILKHIKDLMDEQLTNKLESLDARLNVVEMRLDEADERRSA